MRSRNNVDKRVDQKLDRILDANFNRTKEGLRVCEDVCRFFLNERRLTQRFKAVRHELTRLIGPPYLQRFLQGRAIAQDVGRRTSAPELKRQNLTDVFYANCQRVKESIRVLEEFLKLRDRRAAMGVKKLRYSVYDLEKQAALQLPALPHSRHSRP